MWKLLVFSIIFFPTEKYKVSQKEMFSYKKTKEAYIKKLYSLLKSRPWEIIFFLIMSSTLFNEDQNF